MKLYLIHCGFYDAELCAGIYESHVNYFIAAENFDEARTKVKALPEFKQRHMHVDGVQEIAAVGGFKIELTRDESLREETIVHNFKHRDLAPQPKPPTL